VSDKRTAPKHIPVDTLVHKLGYPHTRGFVAEYTGRSYKIGWIRAGGGMPVYENNVRRNEIEITEETE
jgi:hypothetical protein